ncbi:hypothetical protein [Paenarthrobacter nicotinovorans]|uniref:hypothetical protein n=1 Tax=Paenarthrobacter nicotinovorans TaxID=29320 RepID=UPI00119FB09B|nr:hypothetical protein [Paenarthrobacter nicotinovorans]
MKFETAAAEETNLPLDVDQAAHRAGITVPSFRTLMSKINGTPADLRTPAKTGERARKYDLDKLDAWIRAGRPVGDSAAQEPQGPPVHVAATATWTGTRWNIAAEDPQTSVAAGDLKTAMRTVAEEAASLMGIPGRVVLDLSFDVDAAARRKWSEAADLRARGEELQRQAAQKRREVVRALVETGMSLPDIGQVLGISYSRVQQINTGDNP